MNRTLQPREFLLVTSSGRVNRNQQKVIDHLIEEKRVLKGKLRGKRIRLTGDERREPPVDLVEPANADVFHGAYPVNL